MAAAFDSIHEERSPMYWNDWPIENIYEEEEEFMSIEKVDDSYVIRTSPYPFRPERGNFKQTREKNVPINSERNIPETGVITEEWRREPKSRAEHMAKFTYFLNPASRPELMNYKMSRKDKKHSETYYERMKRKQRELESSIMTLTQCMDRNRIVDNRIEASRVDRSIATIVKKENVTEMKKIDIQKLMERRRDSKVLKKIREKSAQRRKKFAPKPLSRVQPVANPRKVNDYENFERKRKIEKYGTTSSKFDYGNNEYLTKSKNDVKMVENKEYPIVLKGDKRTFLVTKVNEEASKKLKETIYSSQITNKIADKDKFDNKDETRSIISNKIEMNLLKNQMSDKQRLKSRSMGELEKDKEITPKILKPQTNLNISQERSSPNILVPNISFLYTYRSKKA